MWLFIYPELGVALDQAAVNPSGTRTVIDGRTRAVYLTVSRPGGVKRPEQSKPMLDPNQSGMGCNLTTRIVEDLGGEIVTKKFSGEAPFPVEAELCRRDGVSRTTVREAVKMLTAKAY